MEDNVKYKILVVDDEQANLNAIENILTLEYEIVTAHSGEEALRRVTHINPDIILVDTVMPCMDGFKTLTRLKEIREIQNIPIIIITEKNNEDDEERGFLLGAVDYISKPFKKAIIRARIRTHLRIYDQMRTIEHLSLIDALTNIPNRRNFDDKAIIEWRRCARERKPISFLMMDIDHFKIYNDTYGHPQGDILLTAVAKIFTDAARRPSDIAARLGGEEFGLLLPDATLENAMTLAERIRQEVGALQIPTHDGLAITSATISIGVASIVPGEHDILKNFIAKADEYLYTAKESGRNTVYTGELNRVSTPRRG
ncbi:MAG: diguanylate cyclase [Synergistaceae bacterium]|jgi:diguanylate cyclase (GGDEF)-like protein|nr:diguanylate cyclase [Synergistaceae bacterium]